MYSLPGRADARFSGRVDSRARAGARGMEVSGVNTGRYAAEFIDAGGVATSITAYGAPPFAGSAIKAFDGGLGHQVLHGTQALAVRGRCVRVWFESYQMVDASNNVVGNVQAPAPPGGDACVVFRTAG